MSKESKLKLTIPLSDLHRVRRQAWLRKLANGQAKHKTLVSVYFDTDTFKLHDHGISLQVRKEGQKRLQTVKAGPDGSKDVFGRQAWESKITGKKPNYDLAKDTPLAPLLTSKLRRTLHPVFETTIERTILPVRLGKSLIEVTVDHGQIRAALHRLPISEIALELKTGNPVDVTRLGQMFRRNLPVSYDAHTKTYRGYTLITNTRGKPVEAADIALLPNASVAKAFTVIGLACLDHLVSNEEAVLRGASEGVHQMRVGLRRLRAAISVFNNVVRGPEVEKVKSELKWLTEALGPARDFDVLITESVAPLQMANPKNSEIALLRTDLVKKRQSGFDKAKAAVRSDHYRKLILQTALWLANGKWVQNTDVLVAAQRRRRVEGYAREILKDRAKKVIKNASRVQSLDARHRHKLRISTKKLRYATEFFERIFQKKRAEADRKEFQKSLKALQDALGRLNDIVVQERLTWKYAHPKQRGHRRPAKPLAMGLLTSQKQSKAKACMAAAIDAGKRLRDAPRYWQ